MIVDALQTAQLTRADKTAHNSNDAYAYISGLVKAQELRLIDQTGLNRLLEAREPDDIGRVLAENGYPARPHPEEMLQAETIDLLMWLRQQMPDPGFADALLVFHDGHNLKLVLKKLLTVWLAAQSAKTELASADQAAEEQLISAAQQIGETGLPDFGVADGIPSPGAVLSLAQFPAQVTAAELYNLIAEHRVAELPTWLGNAALAAIKCYLQRYDLGDVDLLLDQLTWRQAHLLAAGTGNAFFQDWLQWRTDLINFDLLLRTRILHSGQQTLERALLSGGSITEQDILALYGATDEAVKDFYAETPYAELAELASQYARPGQASRFGRLVDNWLMERLRDIRWVISGPEVPLAWVLARQAEIKNIRIILTCLRNGLPRSMAQDLMRDGFLTWR